MTNQGHYSGFILKFSSHSTYQSCFHSSHLLVLQQSAEKIDSLLLWRNHDLCDQESWVYVHHGDYPNVAEGIRENKVYGIIEICWVGTLDTLK